MMRLLVVLCSLAMVLAGCSDGGGGPRAGDEVVVHSDVPGTNVTSDDDPGAATKGKLKGLLAGTVVNDAIQPINNATVRLPGMDLEDLTDWDGAYAFSNLPVGNYKVVVTAEGYLDAQTVVGVEADEITKVRFQLKAIPPPDPFHYTQVFDGYTDVTDSTVFGTGFFCGTCTFNFFAGGPGMQAVVLEASMEPFAGITQGTIGSNSFYHNLGSAGQGCCSYLSSGSTANPMNVVLKGGVAPMPQTDTAFDLYVSPESFPVPETSKTFQVYVTAWHNSDPPAGWSYLTEGQQA